MIKCCVSRPQMFLHTSNFRSWLGSGWGGSLGAKWPLGIEDTLESYMAVLMTHEGVFEGIRDK